MPREKVLETLRSRTEGVARKAKSSTKKKEVKTNFSLKNNATKPGGERVKQREEREKKR